jgi:IS5 family transposase
MTPGVPKKSASPYQKRKARARFRRRAAIEPRIGHLKSDFRLGRNFLKGQQGDSINLLLAATAANLSLWMRRVLSALLKIISNLPLQSPSFTLPKLQRAF